MANMLEVASSEPEADVKLDVDREIFVLYYQYKSIADPLGLCTSQRELCERLNLKGRIRISSEGINGTLSGKEREMLEYMAMTDEVCGLPSIHWKTSGLLPGKEGEMQRFQTLSCQVTKEVVSLDLCEAETELVKKTECGVHLSPEEFHQVLKDSLQEEGGYAVTGSGSVNNRKELVLIDVRSFVVHYCKILCVVCCRTALCTHAVCIIDDFTSQNTYESSP